MDPWGRGTNAAPFPFHPWLNLPSQTKLLSGCFLSLTSVFAGSTWHIRTSQSRPGGALSGKGPAFSPEQRTVRRIVLSLAGWWYLLFQFGVFPLRSRGWGPACSVLSNSFQTPGRPRNFLGKNSGVGCHFLLPRSSQSRDGTRVSVPLCPLEKWPHGLYSPWNSPGQDTGVGRLSLCQGIFPTQGSSPGLPHQG